MSGSWWAINSWILSMDWKSEIECRLIVNENAMISWYKYSWALLQWTSEGISTGKSYSSQDILNGKWDVLCVLSMKFCLTIKLENIEAGAVLDQYTW